MTLSLLEAARVVVERKREYSAALDAANARTFDLQADYRTSSLGYARARKLLLSSIDDLKDAAAGEDVRLAAEAGSPMARMLEPNAKDARFDDEVLL